MTDRDSNFSNYTKPPVIEVVCGVNFAPLQNFKAIHLGLFGERIKTDFPEAQDYPPLATFIEPLDSFVPPQSGMEFLETPPLPRVWFLGEGHNGIIQIQPDAFLHNWRKLAPEQHYPRFEFVINNFKKNFEVFQKFAEEFSLGDIAPVQYELTYVNHIPENNFWSKDKALGELFPDFIWRHTPRFLPNYEAANYRTSFRLPDNNGRLHVSIQTGFRLKTREPLVILEFKARGIGSHNSPNSLLKWFAVAHEWIVRGFDDLTSKQAREKLWGEKNERSP